MNRKPQALPHEATVSFLVEQEVQSNAAVQEFMDTVLTPYEAERFMQFLQHVGYVCFQDGLKRPVSQAGLSEENQGRVLAHEADLFLQGASELFDYRQEGGV